MKKKAKLCRGIGATAKAQKVKQEYFMVCERITVTENGKHQRRL
jgi:hypothetical protein